MELRVKELKNGLKVCVDWIAFTVKDMSPELVIDELGIPFENFSLSPRGSNGYKSGYRVNGYPIAVYFDGNEDMGVHVVISGSAVEYALSQYSSEHCDSTDLVMLDFLSMVKRIGHITRLDLAIDDLGNKYFGLDDLENLIDAGCCISKWRNHSHILDKSFAGEKTGHTVYFGSRKSECFCRVYDKQLEMMAKGKADESAQAWVRWELELKNSLAQNALYQILERGDFGSTVAGILNNYIRFIVLDDCNKSRCSSHPVWESFIQTVEKVRIYIPPLLTCVQDKGEWIIKNVMPTLAGIIIADYGSLDIISDNINRAVKHMNKHMPSLVFQVNPDFDFDSVVSL